jgi:hypothetical protein
MPADLESRQFYEFGKALPVHGFFSQTRDYKVSWRGKDFQSSTITVTVRANAK